MKVTQTTIAVRVRYAECDPMNVVHHSVYPIWFELARTELLREQGGVYREMEQAGVFCVVARLNVRYRRPVRYDDELTVHVKALPGGGVKIEHAYEVRRGTELLTTAETTLVCVDSDGKLRPVPDALAM
ncbi:MAG: thioesterase family protein [Phycisphaeraceae bacterium]